MERYEELSPLALAFMGDAVHTAFVREWVLKGRANKVQNYHTFASKFCNAKTQMQTLERLLPTLTDDEKEIARKARNCHSKHTAKNFDEETYKKATAFEALVGFLYLSGQRERLEEILKASVENGEDK